ncbi:MAG TPA: CHRD domain-containing protein [Bryobacteraceae bacterium]|nr:CHRD domain-containing protein [Bryobacteraceae bacterium]
MKIRKLTTNRVPPTRLRRLALAVFVLSAGFGRAQDTHGMLLRAELVPFSQVPSVLAKSSGSFNAEAQSDGTIQYSLFYANMSSPVSQAHIHFGANNTNGGVMLFLCGGGSKPACPASGSVTGTITAADVSVLPSTNGDSVIPQGIQPGDLAGMMSAIQAGKTYVNVHTNTFPNGEIRGQVQVR